MKIVNNKYTSILIPVLCIPIQFIIVVVLSPKLSVLENHLYAVASSVTSRVLVIIPALGMLGIYLGVKNLRRNGFSVMPAAGVGINILWVLLFSIVWLLLLTGVTV